MRRRWSARRAEAEEKLGPIDVWVNDAMVSVFSPVKEMEASDYKRVTEVLYLGFVHGTLAALKRMLPRDRGTIIQIGSALTLSVDTVAVGLLRLQACDQWVYGFAAVRAAS